MRICPLESDTETQIIVTAYVCEVHRKERETEKETSDSYSIDVLMYTVCEIFKQLPTGVIPGPLQ